MYTRICIYAYVCVKVFLTIEKKSEVIYAFTSKNNGLMRKKKK